MCQIQNNKDLVYELLGWVTGTQVTYFLQIHMLELQCLSIGV